MIDNNKALKRRLLDEVMNANDLDEICSPALPPKLRIAFTQFRTAFREWHQELVELVAENATVVVPFSRARARTKGSAKGSRARAGRWASTRFASFGSPTGS